MGISKQIGNVSSASCYPAKLALNSKENSFLMRANHNLSQTLSRFVVNLNSSGKSTRQRVAMGVDWMVSMAALAAASILRLGEVDITQLWPVFIVIPVFTVLLFSGVGVYAMVIRFSGLDEMAPVVKGVIASSLTLLIVLFLLNPDPNPRSLFCLLYTSPSPRDRQKSRMPSSA